ncbi:MAG: hypothetical protein KKB37_09180 [Alphaproteobacteria bacterium]|nr:hypothetical protein [Alphaproteobacteria bacterium]
MRFNLVPVLRPAAAYLSAVMLAALCWLEATSAIANAPDLTRVNAPESTSVSAERAPRPHLLPIPLNRSPAPGLQSGLRPPKNRLGEADRLATLRAIDIALTTVGDGGAYVWRRGNGHLSGFFRPTTSFKGRAGEICRHLVIQLSFGHYTRRAEGIACREKSGAWTLSG